jgi:hypothetical protein
MQNYKVYEIKELTLYRFLLIHLRKFLTISTTVINKFKSSSKICNIDIQILYKLIINPCKPYNILIKTIINRIITFKNYQ